MQLIGMLDSPYVRRVAVSLQLLDVPFTHRPLSVFSAFEQFRAINPVVKAPTLVCDDGTVLLDSTLIIDYAERLVGRTLLPREPVALSRALRIVGLALAACEKSVQIVYERNLRPPEKQHAPWIERVMGQLLAACDELEKELKAAPRRTDGQIDQSGLTTAIAWDFTQQMISDCVPAAKYPRLTAWSVHAETLPAFRAAPFGNGTCPVS